jgi:predicted ABC-type ATPase
MCLPVLTARAKVASLAQCSSKEVSNTSTPNEAAEQIRVANPGVTLEKSQSGAWDEGRGLLERAIDERLDYAFETTLGGRTIPALLEKAMEAGIEVRIWYVGLTNVELHIARVQARVKRGGHDIPEERIRERYARSLLNLIQLMPKLTELRVYDNSVEADPHTGATPEPRLIVHLNRGKLLDVCELASTPEWAKPIVLRALTSRL